jgi:hypothetical protein
VRGEEISFTPLPSGEGLHLLELHIASILKEQLKVFGVEPKLRDGAAHGVSRCSIR